MFVRSVFAALASGVLLVGLLPAHEISPSGKRRWSSEELAAEKRVWHLANQRRLAEQKGAAARSIARTSTITSDVNDMTFMQGDAFTVATRNPFDLNGLSVTFTPSGSGYRVTSAAGTFDTSFGTKLDFAGSDSVNPTTLAEPGDDAYIPTSLGFGFPFYGKTYSQVAISTNGNLTFRPSDITQDTFDRRTVDSGESLAGLQSSLPRIAPYWHDLDARPAVLTSSTGIYLRKDSDKILVTYNRISDFANSSTDDGTHTFQVALLKDGRIVFTYSIVELTTRAITGISAGPGSDTPTLVDLSRSPTDAVLTPIAEFFTTDNVVDDISVISNFYATHKDQYDFVYMMTDFDSDLGDAFAFYSKIRNDAQGINDDAEDFDPDGSLFGSTRIQGYVNLGNIIANYPDSPVTRLLAGNHALSVFGQEQGHRWLAYVKYTGTNPNLLLGRDDQHWSFFMNTESTLSRPGARRSSSSEGNVWRNNNDGTFTSVSLIDGYSKLDHYLMGLRPASDVPDTFIIANPTTRLYTRESNPRPNATTGGRSQTVTVGEILSANGARVPDSTSAPKNFRAAWVLLTLPGKSPAQSSINKLLRYRLAWESYFSQATDYLGVLNTGIEESDGSRVIAVSSAAASYPVLPPGSIGTIFGKGLTDGGTAATTSTTLPTTLAGAQVNIDGVPAKLFFASPTQINFQVPASTRSATAPNGLTFVSLDSSTSLIEVLVNGQLIRAGSFQVNASSPMIFTLDGTAAAALDAFTFTGAPFNTKRANGDPNIISVYGTGAGTDATDVDANLAAQFTATIDGRSTPISYAGRAPGFPGLNQFNIVLPADATPGTHKLIVLRNSIPSNDVAITIR